MCSSDLLYGHGTAESRLGRILRNVKEPYIIETKVGRILKNVDQAEPVPWFPDADPHIEPVFDYSKDGILRSLEDSLKRLGVDHIDIALMHDCENHVDEAISNAYPILHTLKSQGVIKAIGVGLNFPDIAMRIMSEVDLDIDRKSTRLNSSH